MKIRFESIDDGEAVIVEHADGGRSMVCERQGMVATLSLSAFEARQLRHSIANTEAARKRKPRHA